jgi:hypothetical protein
MCLAQLAQCTTKNYDEQKYSSMLNSMKKYRYYQRPPKLQMLSSDRSIDLVSLNFPQALEQ